MRILPTLVATVLLFLFICNDSIGNAADEHRAEIDKYVSCTTDKAVMSCSFDVKKWKYENVSLANKDEGWIKLQHYTMAWVVSAETLALMSSENAKQLRFIGNITKAKEDKYGNATGEISYKVVGLTMSRAALEKVNMKTRDSNEAVGSLRGDLFFVNWCKAFVKATFDQRHF